MRGCAPRSLLDVLVAASLAIAGCGPAGAEQDDSSPRIRLSRESVRFAETPVGLERVESIEVFHQGLDGVLQLEPPRLEGPDATSFRAELADDALLAGASTSLRIVFEPVRAGRMQASLLLASNSVDRPTMRIELSGSTRLEGLRIEPDLLSFGYVLRGTRETLGLEVINDGAEDLVVTLWEGGNVERCDAGASAVFCVRGLPGGADGTFTVAAGGVAAFEVDFTPVISGVRERGVFTLGTCESSLCNVQVQLEGNGVEQSLLHCDRLDFETVGPETCRTLPVGCENIGNQPLAVAAWRTSADTSAEYRVEASRAVTVAPQGRLDIEVTYCPVDLGEDVGGLEITIDTPPLGQVAGASLTGRGGGPDIEVLPPQLDFGLVSQIAPSRRTVLVANVGFEDLEISEIVIDTAGTGAFTAPGAGATVIPPGGAYEITVEFDPPAEGPIESTLLIRSNDLDEPEFEVRLLGEGIVFPSCDFAVQPAVLDVGPVQVGRTATGSFEIRNNGVTDCLVTSARPEPGTDPEFSLPDGDVRSQIITPGAAFTVRVDYAPTAVGTHTGAIEFSISSATSPFNRVPVTGVGAP